MMTDIQNEQVYRRAIEMLLGGGKDAFDGLHTSLSSDRLDGWQLFPSKYQELAKRLWSFRGNVQMHILERGLTAEQQTLLNECVKASAKLGRYVLRDYQDQGAYIADAFIDRAIKAKGAAIQTGYNNGDITADEYFAQQIELREQIQAIGKRRQSMFMQDIARRAEDEALAHVRGESSVKVECGLYQLDAINALLRGEICGIFAPAKEGKTSLAMQMAGGVAKSLHAGNKRGCVVIFSMEMTQEQLTYTLASQDSGFNLQWWRNLRDDDGNEITEQDHRFQSFLQRVRSYRSLPIVVDERAGLSASRMQDTLKMAKEAHGEVTLIVLDYARLAKSDEKSSNEALRVENVFKEFKAMVKNFENPTGQLPAGLMVSERKRDTEDHAIPTKESIKYGGDYTLACAISPMQPHKTPDDKGVQRVTIQGELAPQERWLVVPFNRYGKSGILRDWRFREYCQRWEKMEDNNE